ncbi:unnamed protein product [Ilex paraguariensis]|uniref:Bidirectional sugar transporter SWEET n=1 Tax=Ilex paraguariensis TaxID=185542 RepID=A0ABC8QWN0_9AQUA
MFCTLHLVFGIFGGFFYSFPLSFCVCFLIFHFSRIVFHQFSSLIYVFHLLCFLLFTGDAFGLLLFLAPMVTFKRIIMNKSTEQFSGIPYVMTLLNCLLSFWYGLPFVSKNNVQVSVINGTGAVLEFIYVLIFLIFAPKKEKAKILGLLTFILTVFSAIAFVSMLALRGKNRNRFCGLAASVFSIIMYASPLSVMRMVIKTKSVEFMPFFLSLFVFLCGTSWFIFGLLGKDPFIYVSNGFGSALGAMQLILYAIYRDKKKGDTKKTIGNESLEMGLDKPHLPETMQH